MVAGVVFSSSCQRLVAAVLVRMTYYHLLLLVFIIIIIIIHLILNATIFVLPRHRKWVDIDGCVSIVATVQ